MVITNAIKDFYIIIFITLMGLLSFVKYMPILTVKLAKNNNKVKYTISVVFFEWLGVALGSSKPIP